MELLICPKYCKPRNGCWQIASFTCVRLTCERIHIKIRISGGKSYQTLGFLNNRGLMKYFYKKNWAPETFL